MNRELKRGTLELVLLALLRDGDRYGYEIVTELDGTFEMKEGTLYPVLYRLENAGLVESYWETQERGPARKYYRITPEGRVSLKLQTEEWRSFVAVVDQVLGGKGDHE